MLTAMQVEHWEPDADGELTEENLRRKIEGRGYRVSRYVYPPGTYFPPHDHAVDKIDGVLSKCYRMITGGQSVNLESGDCLHVPRRAVHSAKVVGSEPVVGLDAVRG